MGVLPVCPFLIFPPKETSCNQKKSHNQEINIDVNHWSYSSFLPVHAFAFVCELFSHV